MNDTELLNALERLLAHDEPVVLVTNDEGVWLERGMAGPQMGVGRTLREAIEQASLARAFEAAFETHVRGSGNG